MQTGREPARTEEKQQKRYLNKILIVDDAKIMRVLLKQILEKNGFNIFEEAADCDEGYDKYMSFKPDITTMDIEMPSSGAYINGLCVLKKIVQQDKGAKIVMISARGSAQKVKEAIVSGAKDFIVKPFDEKRVIDTVMRLITPKEAVAKAPSADSVKEECDKIFERAHSFLKNGKYNEAIDSFSRIIRIAPDYQSAYDKIAYCYYRQKNNEMAQKFWEKLLELDPHNESAQKSLYALSVIQKS